MQDLNDILKIIRDRLIYIGGAPATEIISEAYLCIGVNTYSSAVFNFLPDLAIHFYKSLRAGHQEVVQQIIKEFYIPFIQLSAKKKGYAVCLVKVETRLIGRGIGNVRPPFVMPNHMIEIS